MAACPAFDPLGPYVSSVVSYVDCQGLAIGEAGYRALGTGSPFGMALTGLLTIYVALIGYRLLLGGDVTVRQSLFTALRLGLVLALVTQWQAYRVLVFDWVTKVPEAAAAGISGPAGIAGGSSIAGRIDNAGGTIASLLNAPQKAQAPAPAQIAAPGQPQPPVAARPTVAADAPGSDTLRWAVGVLTVSALAGLVTVRLITALLLALGPGFIAALLFDGTREIFVGWVRVLGGTFLAAIAVPVVIGLELALVEPQVGALRDLVGSGLSLEMLPAQLLATTLFFALVLAAVMFAMLRAGLAFRLPRWSLGSWQTSPQPAPVPLLPAPAWATAGGAVASNDSPNRAQRIADAAQALQWREARMAELAQPARTAMPRDDGTSQPLSAPIPLGQQGRRTAQRQSVAASRRDAMT